jgi:hypothetical protein
MLVRRLRTIGTVVVGILMLLEANAAEAQSDLAARKELVSLGTTWSAENFRIAVMNHDYTAVELFLKGGIDPHNDIIIRQSIGGSFLTIFAIARNFDDKTASLIMEYPNVIDAPRDCPTSTANYGGREVEQFVFYTKDTKNNPGLAKFIRFFCDKPAVIAKIDEHISELRARHNDAGAITGWADARAFLAGSP